jgi:hypothetical protein
MSWIHALTASPESCYVRRRGSVNTLAALRDDVFDPREVRLEGADGEIELSERDSHLSAEGENAKS